MEPRKVTLLREQLCPEPGAPAGRPITRAAGLVCFENPLVGAGFAEDLSILFDAGRYAGNLVSADLVKLLDGSPVSYGKAAIVGISGFMEHGAACIHPKLGKPMRDAVGGGKAVIPSNCKVASAGGWAPQSARWRPADHRLIKQAAVSRTAAIPMKFCSPVRGRQTITRSSGQSARTTAALRG
jgi:hypothetical protein